MRDTLNGLKAKRNVHSFSHIREKGYVEAGSQMRDMFQEVRRTACKFYTAQQIVIWKRRSVNKWKLFC